MIRDGHENVKFFIGPEVEHTPANSKKTLFVVGKQDLDAIKRVARENKTPHIFMGANHSFEIDNSPYWQTTIAGLLDLGFWVSLDYEAHLHDKVLKMLSPGIWQSRLFVPLLSVRIPHLASSNPNLTVKIDDIDFKATNEGVWCMHFRELMDSNRFTDWSEYTSDEIIQDSVVAPVVAKAPVADILPKEIEKEEVVEEVKNQPELGLDTSGKSQLKEEPVEEVVATPVDAAEAYAEGAKVDPLGKETSKKPKATKKVEA